MNIILSPIAQEAFGLIQDESGRSLPRAAERIESAAERFEAIVADAWDSIRETWPAEEIEAAIAAVQLAQWPDVKTICGARWPEAFAHLDAGTKAKAASMELPHRIALIERARIKSGLQVF